MDERENKGGEWYCRDASFWLAVVLAVFLFTGEPDLTDALIDHLTCEAPE